MISVTIKLHSAITGKTTVLGRMFVWNKGGSADPSKGDYGVGVMRKGKEDDYIPLTGPIPEALLTRKGEVENYPRLAYNVWRLISRELISAFPEEKTK